MKLPCTVLLLVLSIVLVPVHVLALWPPNGVPLCTATNVQQWPSITTDGVGGAIVTWYDKRGVTDLDIYVQRVNNQGLPQWTLNGVAVCVASGDQMNPVIVSDNAGGAILAWQDERDGNLDIYTQRVNANGVLLWTANGVALCTVRNDQSSVVVDTDGDHGAVAAWQDFRDGNLDIYGGRVDAGGNSLWPDGIPICVQPFIQYVPGILYDGNNRVLITWPDFRNGTDYDIFAQLVDVSGGPQWAPNGVKICGAPFGQAAQSQTLDGLGGFIVTWVDLRGGIAWDIFAQRIDDAGDVQWTADGVPICEATDDQFYPTIASDGSNGAIIAWEDLRDPTTGRDIYAQRVNVAGSVQWSTDGEPLCTARKVQTGQMIIPDGAHGGIVAWYDIRNNTDYDIYVQHVDGSGTSLWTPDGYPLCGASQSQFGSKLVADGSGGAIVTWHDLRNGNYDIYAQRIGFNGTIPTSVGNTPRPLGVTLSDNFPNPFSVATEFHLTLDAEAMVQVDVYDVAGRLVRRLGRSTLVAGPHRLTFDGRDDQGRPLSSGVYFYSVRADGVTQTRKLIIGR